MALIDTIPTTEATKPSALSQVTNGKLPADWLRSFDGTTRDDFKMFVPVSYAMQALHIAAAKDGITFRTTGRYRSYARQEALFRERYRPGDNDSCGSKQWQGQTWYLQRSAKGGCFAMAATPGTSNHGWGIADDFSEWDEGDSSVGSSLDLADLQWLATHARSFGFALDTRSENWHWHWYMPNNPNTLSQRTVDVLKAAGVKIPDLSRWGFTIPGGTTPTPTPPPVDPVTPPPPAVIEDSEESTMWLIGRTSDTGDRFLASPRPRGGAYHVPSEVPNQYVFAAGGGEAFDVGGNKAVTDWGQCVKVPQAQLLAIMGAEV